MELTDKVNNPKNIGFIRKALIAGTLFAAAILTPGCLGKPAVNDIPYSDRKVQSTAIGYRGRKEHCEMRYWQSDKFPGVTGTDVIYNDGNSATFSGHTNPRSVDYTLPVKTTSSDRQPKPKKLIPATPPPPLCLNEHSDGKHALPTRQYHRTPGGDRIGGTVSIPVYRSAQKKPDTQAFFELEPQPKY
ncbi:hypothetical protein GOV06_00140 [Candidatus Woesearchaeota archaeon]|nr:hypothetical protein [Candidatus Woesearchaeota archaeon]